MRTVRLHLIGLLISIVFSATYAADLRDKSVQCSHLLSGPEEITEPSNVARTVIHEAAYDLITNTPDLNAHLKLLPMIPLGNGSFKYQVIDDYYPAISMLVDHQDKNLATEKLSELKRSIKKCCGSGQKALQDVLKDSIDPSAELIYWDTDSKRWLLSRLLVEEPIQVSSLLSKPMQVGGGKLMLGHRPRIKDFENLKAQGFTHVVTLLSEREGAVDLGKSVSRSGMEWVWLPVESGKVPEVDVLYNDITAAAQTLVRIYEENNDAKVYLHCAAGIHRTGMVSLLALRTMGYPENLGLKLINQLRWSLSNEMGDERIKWVNQRVTRIQENQ